MERCNDYSLPEELLIEILSWLPVKSMLRFRCVCKSLYNLHEDPNLASKHLANTNNNVTGDDHRRILVRRRIPYDGIKRYTSLSYETQDVIHQDLGFEYPEAVDVLGCFNGLVCLYNRPEAHFVIWNPATRQFKILPECIFTRPPDYAIYDWQYGFGYDFKTNDYKVIATACLLVVSKNGRFTRNRVTEIYSLSTDSWRQIDKRAIPDGFRIGFIPAACINGVCCMLLSSVGDGGYHLLKFDMSDEVSIVTPTSGLEKDEDDNALMTLTSLNNSLALASCDVEEQNFEIFVLNEDGSCFKWTLLYTIRRFPASIWPLKLRKNDEFLFNYCNGELVLCDSTSHILIRLNTIRECTSLLEYRESLVSLNGVNHH